MVSIGTKLQFCISLKVGDKSLINEVPAKLNFEGETSEVPLSS